jgi:DnaJ-class molecular chaperone
MARSIVPSQDPREDGIEYKDYYKTLGVAKNATEKEIKAAYRRLARKYHPDVNQGDAKAEARFKEVNEAHEVLSDRAKRKRYDQLGSDWARYRTAPAGAGPFGGGRVRVETGGFGADLGGFSDFFRTFFGGGFAGFGGGEPGGFPEAMAEQGNDVEHEIELSLEEVLRGATRLLGLGPAGKGQRKVEVKIPAGVREGSRVRVAGEGGGSGRGKGDLYLKVRIAAHPVFERLGEDLQTAVGVPLTTAVLGGEASVPTLEGPVGIKIPAGTSSGQTFRLRGHGLPRREGGGRGDVLANVVVQVPKGLSTREHELFEELKRMGR